MATLPPTPPQDAGPPEQPGEPELGINPPPPGLEKAAQQVTQGLAMMYKLCHVMDPDSPACGALQEIQRAMAEIEKHIGLHEQGPKMPPSGGGPFAKAAWEGSQMIAPRPGP